MFREDFTGAENSIETIHLETRSEIKKLHAEITLTPKESLDHPIDISNEQISKGCQRALERLQKNNRYGTEIKELIKQIGFQELIYLMLAVAEQESGRAGKIGALSLYRYEKKLQTYSAGYFHVLIGTSQIETPKGETKQVKHAGQKALENLNLCFNDLSNANPAIRALYNASLFLATLVEKKLEYAKSPKVQSQRMSYLSNRVNNFESFARFYNGDKWEKHNPNYVKNCSQFYIKNKLQSQYPNQNIESATKIVTEILSQNFITTNPDSGNNYKEATLKDNFKIQNNHITVERSNKKIDRPIPNIQEIILSAVKKSPAPYVEYFNKYDPSLKKTKAIYTSWMIKILGRDQAWNDDNVNILWSTRHQCPYLKVSGVNPEGFLEVSHLRLAKLKNTPCASENNTPPKANIEQQEIINKTPYKLITIQQVTSPISDAVRRASKVNSEIKGENWDLLQLEKSGDTHVLILAQKIVDHIKTLNPPHALADSDQISVWNDKKNGTHAIFKRGSHIQKFNLHD